MSSNRPEVTAVKSGQIYTATPYSDLARIGLRRYSAHSRGCRASPLTISRSIRGRSYSHKLYGAAVSANVEGQWAADDPQPSCVKTGATGSP